ncbi:endolytic transglycosylase MltG [Pelotalea chapellei]|uniref:Endolytic murein transglycosylase n=1 Tax=Pelotalea chapellei TaxID=44671 RepID=A0ABS5UBN5_9BACT|nr:endolytic transglycosylase MltG [Pelotalea chapellei]MBT1073058.1 endolytic transglycosylase MltG [Pelotalea chapellei]
MFPVIRTPRISVIFLIRICLASLLVWYLFCLWVPVGNGSVVKDISFPPGKSVRTLATELKTKGIIRSSWHFMVVSRLRGQANRLKAGDYRLNSAMTPGYILHKVATGDVDFRRFALPEGYSIYQAAELLEQKGYFPKERFLERCRDTALLTSLGIPASSVEGYLFPATYDLPLNSTEEQLIRMMVSCFKKNVVGQQGGLIRHDLVTLASMIEKEAVSAEEKPLISSVFHNRLRIGMPLQSDPTAVYGVRAFAGKVTKADILRPSPYNTYLNRGLPAGPIGNPGAEALKAALTPATTDYLYFVARQDGTHQFSRTLAEHNRAVTRFLR